jgi:hypothetical protein
MKNKVFIFALLLSMIIVSGTWAQNLPAFPIAPGTTSKSTWASSIWTSPQSSTTEGRYRSNADDFIRPDSYTGVKFDKWFGMTSFLWAGEENSGDAIATAGFAARISKVYIGALYTGNFWTNMQINNYTEREFAAAPAGGVDGKTYNDYSSISVSADPGNNFALLIGIADMGFRLTYRTNYQAFKESGIVTGNQLYKNYETDEGYIAPQIAWAMAKDLTKNGIRPYAAVDLVFYREYKKTETSGADSNNNTGTRIVYSKNRFDPSLSVGLGGYTLYNKDGFKLSCDLDYALTLNFYDNEFGYAEGGVYKTGKIKGTFSENGNLAEEFSVSNLLTPSLSGSWSRDALALKFKLNLPLKLSGRESNLVDLNSENKLIYSGPSESTTTFTFQPDLRLAFQYKIIPNRLTLNTGARIQATAFTAETVEQKSYDNTGREVAGSKQKIHRDSVLNPATGTQFVSRFNIGPSFNFTENVWVEATTGVTKVFGEGAVDVFAPGGLLSFGSILVGLKF